MMPVICWITYRKSRTLCLKHLKNCILIFLKRSPKPDISIYREAQEEVAVDLKNKVLPLITNGNAMLSALKQKLETNQLLTKEEHETLKAIAYYADQNNFKNDQKLTDKKGPSFSVYRNPHLKDILKAITHGKCAYCEMDFLSNARADIEHFRPKGAINSFSNEEDEKLIYPGYYWLAADWNNLLWSCQLCNRRNKLGVATSPSEVKSIGKKNRFPVHPPEKRIRDHNKDIKQEHEVALLIHPYYDDPEKHLRYFVDETKSNFGVITPFVDKNNKPDPKGKASIPTFALNRTDLVAKRVEEGLTLQFLFKGIIDKMELLVLKKAAGEDIDAVKSELKQLKTFIIEKLSPKSSFIGFKKALCEDIKNWPKFKALRLKMETFLKELPESLE